MQLKSVPVERRVLGWYENNTHKQLFYNQTSPP